MASKTRRRTKKKRAHRKVLRWAKRFGGGRVVFGGGPNDWVPLPSRALEVARRQIILNKIDKDRPSMFWLPSYLDWKVNRKNIDDRTMGSISAQFDSMNDATRNMARERLRTELEARDIQENPDEYIRAWRQGKHKRNNWVKWAARAGITTAALLGTGLGLYHWGIPGLMNPLSGGLKNAFVKAAATEGAKTGADKIAETLTGDAAEDTVKTTAEKVAENAIGNAAANVAGTSSDVAENVVEEGVKQTILEQDMNNQNIPEDTQEQIQEIATNTNSFDDLKTKSEPLKPDFRKDQAFIPNEVNIDVPDYIPDKEDYLKQLSKNRELFQIDPDENFTTKSVDSGRGKIKTGLLWGTEADASQYHNKVMNQGIVGRKYRNRFKEWEKNYLKNYYETHPDAKVGAKHTGMSGILNFEDQSPNLKHPNYFSQKSTALALVPKEIQEKRNRKELRKRLDDIATNQGRNKALTTNWSFPEKEKKTIEVPDEDSNEGWVDWGLRKIGFKDKKKTKKIEVPIDYDEPHDTSYHFPVERNINSKYRISHPGLPKSSRHKSAGIPYTQVPKANALVPYTGGWYNNPHLAYLQNLPQNERNIILRELIATNYPIGGRFKVTKRGRRLLRKYRRHTKKRTKH